MQVVYNNIMSLCITGTVLFFAVYIERRQRFPSVKVFDNNIRVLHEYCMYKMRIRRDNALLLGWLFYQITLDSYLEKY